MTRKRSRYRPRGINPTAHLVALQGCMLLHKDDAIDFASQVREAVTAITRGQGTEAHWAILFAAIAVAEQLARRRLVEDADGALADVQRTVQDIIKRQAERGTRALYPAEIACLDGFAADYSDILCKVTHSELFQAQESAKVRIDAAAAGNGDPNVIFLAKPAP